jgi:hypothetical protein
MRGSQWHGCGVIVAERPLRSRTRQVSFSIERTVSGLYEDVDWIELSRGRILWRRPALINMRILVEQRATVSFQRRTLLHAVTDMNTGDTN